MGGGGRHENLALGETPNIAARLEGLAAPNSVVISPVTTRLVQRAFDVENLGSHGLKGVSEPMTISRVMGTVEPESIGPAMKGFGALVGRDEEIGLLLRRWGQSKEGQGQVILLSGEAGIGKSSLVNGLQDRARQEGMTRVTLRCSPYHTSSALYPIIASMQRTLGWQSDDTEDTKLTKLEQALEAANLALHEAAPLMASLLSMKLPAGRYPALTSSPQQLRQQTQDTFGGLVTSGSRASTDARSVGRLALGRPIDVGSAGTRIRADSDLTHASYPHLSAGVRAALASPFPYDPDLAQPS